MGKMPWSLRVRRGFELALAVLFWAAATGAAAQLDRDLAPAVGRQVEPQPEPPPREPARHEEELFQPWEHVST
jgi:hypothetical protein